MWQTNFLKMHMIIINKFFERLSRLFKCFVSRNYTLHHRYQNKNQITNAELILDLLKRKNFIPEYIIDIGCGYGQWTKKLLKFYPSSRYLLFDADKNNIEKLNVLINKYSNVSYKICLLSDDNKSYKFYNMGYGSSIFEEQTSHKRKVFEISSTTLNQELPPELNNHTNNLIKLDVQGAELKVLDGLKETVNSFEVIILEVSLHNYNKDSPLFDKVMNYMNVKGFRLYDLFDLKRLGENESFLIQFDCVFVRNNSNLLNVKF